MNKNNQTKEIKTVTMTMVIPNKKINKKQTVVLPVPAMENRNFTVNVRTKEIIELWTTLN